MKVAKSASIALVFALVAASVVACSGENKNASNAAKPVAPLPLTNGADKFGLYQLPESNKWIFEAYQKTVKQVELNDTLANAAAAQNGTNAPGANEALGRLNRTTPDGTYIPSAGGRSSRATNADLISLDCDVAYAGLQIERVAGPFHITTRGSSVPRPTEKLHPSQLASCNVLVTPQAAERYSQSKIMKLPTLYAASYKIAAGESDGIARVGTYLPKALCLNDGNGACTAEAVKFATLQDANFVISKIRFSDDYIPQVRASKGLLVVYELVPHWEISRSQFKSEGSVDSTRFIHPGENQLLGKTADENLSSFIDQAPGKNMVDYVKKYGFADADMTALSVAILENQLKSYDNAIIAVGNRPLHPRVIDADHANHAWNIASSAQGMSYVDETFEVDPAFEHYFTPAVYAKYRALGESLPLWNTGLDGRDLAFASLRAEERHDYVMEALNEKTFEKVNDKANPKAAEKPAEKAPEKADPKVAEKAESKTGEKADPKAADKTAEKGMTKEALTAFFADRLRDEKFFSASVDLRNNTFFPNVKERNSPESEAVSQIIERVAEIALAKSNVLLKNLQYSQGFDYANLNRPGELSTTFGEIKAKALQSLVPELKTANGAQKVRFEWQSIITPAATYSDVVKDENTAQVKVALRDNMFLSKGEVYFRGTTNSNPTTWDAQVENYRSEQGHLIEGEPYMLFNSMKDPQMLSPADGKIAGQMGGCYFYGFILIDDKGRAISNFIPGDVKSVSSRAQSPSKPECKKILTKPVAEFIEELRRQGATVEPGLQVRSDIVVQTH